MREKSPEWLRHIALKQPDFASYLYYMMERLQACRHVLKPTGSIYLHCDYRASHYLKMIMDEIFGYDRMVNEVIWAYRTGGATKSHFGRKHDTIFYYSKTDKRTFNLEKEKSIQSHHYGYKNVPYYVDPDTGQQFRWALPRDVWELTMGTGTRERAGYPTQKPEGLLDKTIRASSNEGGLVLDPFCGCGTTVIVASKLNREWIGIDIDTSPRKKGDLPTAFQVIQNRGHSLFDEAIYVSRDLAEVQELGANVFETWVNEFYKAAKPKSAKGVDGITSSGIPLQAKTYLIKYPVLSEFVTNAKLHPAVPKPLKEIIAVSQTGFDDSARKRKFEIETADGIKVQLETPETMLKLDD
ncbi:DNA-methyltransferase [Chloroflexota bacterium]